MLSDAELFGERHKFKKQTKRREFREGMRITSLLDVKAGDYVVHIHHGVGMYAGLTKMNTAPFPGAPPVEKEFLVIAYEGQRSALRARGSSGSCPKIHWLARAAHPIGQ